MKLIDTIKEAFDFSDDYDEDDEDSYLRDMARIERKNKERQRKSAASDTKITSIFSKNSGSTGRASRALGNGSSSKNSFEAKRTGSRNSEKRSVGAPTRSNNSRISSVKSEGNEKTRSSYSSDTANDRARQKRTGRNTAQGTYRSSRSTLDISQKDSSEISIIKVVNFEDATLVCDKLTKGLPIIVSFDSPEGSQSQRVMDFIAGCIYTINGSLHTISDRIFLFSPDGVDVSGDYINMVKENSFGVPTFNKMI